MSEVIKAGPTKRLWVRITACVLSLALIVSLGVNALVAVKIQTAQAHEAATNYLVENTEYVSAELLERLGEKLRTLPEPMNIEDYYRLAGTQIAEEKYEEALFSIEKCIELFDDNQTDELWIDILMKKGCLEVLTQRFDKAEGTLNAVLQADPEQKEVYLILAQIHAGYDDLDLLEEDLNNYLAKAKDDLQIRALLAQTLFAKEEYEAAGEQYLLILDSQGEGVDMAEMNYLYALTGIQLENYQIAKEHMETAIQLDESKLDAYYYLGICNMAQEEYEKAVESFTKAIDGNSMMQLSYYSRGVCGLMIEEYDYQKALDDLKQTEVYNGADLDPEISAQAADLLAELEAAGLENRPRSEIVISTKNDENTENSDNE
ncbi:MAG: tetratricopeptide repeat protein [Clostridiales bacterium]|nr:tetratricopeptide repeat protein [Clostridiales bacterium]